MTYALVLALLAIATALAFAFATGEAAPPSAPTPASIVEQPAAAPATANREPSLHGVDRTEAPVPVPVPAPPEATGTNIALRGTFVVVDERGGEHDDLDGKFTLVLWHGDMGTHCKVELRAGRWEAEVDRLPEKVGTHDVRIGGRLVKSRDVIEVDGTSPLALRGTWMPLLLLRVVADDTGADLVDVRVVSSGNDDYSKPPHPGNRNVTPIVDHARSPVRLEPTRAYDTQHFWAHAPAYAWNVIELDTETVVERIVRLRPGGDVDVTIVGAPPEGAVLRVRGVQQRPEGLSDDQWSLVLARSGNRPHAELAPTRGKPTRIDGLPVGTWLIDLEKGKLFQDPLSFGRTTVDITAGTIATAAITLRDTAAPPQARVAGTLAVGATWGTDLTLVIEARGATQSWFDDRVRIGLAAMQRQATGEYRWEARTLPAGDYQVLVDGTEYRTWFTLPPQGDENVRIVVPEPCNVRLRVLDAETGRPIGGDWKAGWYSVPPDWEGGWGHAQVEKVADGTFTFRAPPGPISVHAHPDGYQWEHSQHEVVPGSNEITVQIARVCGVEVTLFDGDAKLPWPDDARVDLVDGEGKSAVAYWSSNRTAVERPGDYVLRVDGVEGFEPIPEQKVSIAPSEWRPVEIRLRRKP